MWREVIRLGSEIRPRIILLENSPNLLAGDSGEWFGKLLRSLAEIGFDAAWFCLSASDADAPHKRERVFVIAHAKRFRQQRQGGRIEPLNTAENPYREASGLVDAFQGNALPFLCRGHDGIPKGMDGHRLTALGNAVVPQVVEQIGLAIMAEHYGSGQ